METAANAPSVNPQQEPSDSSGMEVNLPQRHTSFYATTMIVLRVEDTLYRVDIRLLQRFQVFREMFDNAGQHNTDKREGVEDTDPIVLQGVTNFEFESLLRVCEPMQFLGSGPVADFKEWSAVLHLCTMWCYDELREHAIKEIEKLNPAPVDSILLARKCNVTKWLKLAYIQLCNRTEPVTADEGLLLGIHLFAELCHIREKFKPGTVTSQPMIVCGHCSYTNNGSYCNRCTRNCLLLNSCNHCGYSLRQNGTHNVNNPTLDNAIDKILEIYDK
ncbi:hypothetical protein FRC02_004102 [Tulasnella sp. 418]|nr:hypothetical protein FRC02_004102 [Tulasnella sp. 418]